MFKTLLRPRARLATHVHRAGAPQPARIHLFAQLLQRLFGR